MIGSVRGKIIYKTDKFVILEAQGVGYKIYISSDTLSRIKNEDILMWTHAHVREDSFDLYGFLETQELNFFTLLLSVSGVGPRGALSILSIAPLDTLKKAIGSGDTTYLTKVSGIGRKTAEKIVIELRDKIEKGTDGETLQDELDALEALKSLGYSQNEAREALKKIPSEMNTNQKIKEALRFLGGRSK